ncbi:ferritin-like domain-containing protein [Amylibacter sp.]|nr:ferritin-like domain-containing protein [Amylibacter sp.]
MTLSQMAVDILTTSDPHQKVLKSHEYSEKWFNSKVKNELIKIGSAIPPKQPSRPIKPVLLSPRDMPKRKTGHEKGRIALIHAIAHIELNAVDLHWDIIARFSHIKMPNGFYDDWVKAAQEESKHFSLLCNRLESMGSFYGELPAHAGMWSSAEETSEDFLGRLAIVPMVLEARGLDVTPGMIKLFKNINDMETVNTLETIYSEEVGHVAFGSKWFHFLCGRHDKDPKKMFHELVEKYFKSNLKPPFNDEKRAEAGIPMDFYWPIAVS